MRTKKITKDNHTARIDSPNEAVVRLEVLDKSGNCRHKVLAEIADTPALQARGLMFRNELRPDSGMLFTKAGQYWMKNVPVPLDILFIDKAGTVIDVQTMGTTKQAGLRLYTCRESDPSCALELPGNTAARTGIILGDYLVVRR